MGRFGMAGAVVSGTARGLVNYGNRNMSSNMQMDMFGNYGGLAGGIGNGGYQATNNVAMRTTFNNNRIALNANDAARGGYTAAYTFGSPQFSGQANSAYVQGTRMASGFAFASPTIGAAGAMTAAQQTYTSRAFYMSQAMGLAPTITNGGRQNSMGNIAASMVGRTFQGRNSVSQRELDASLRQGGSLSTNLQFYGQQMGWNQTTIQSYENYIRGSNAAQNKGMNRQEYDRLTTIAATGTGDAKKNALDKLKQTTGMGASMFERQRDLNSTRLTRQERILEHLAPAFEKATDMVNKFSAALTKFLESTGLDNAIGTASGTLTPFSNALGGLGSGFGMVGGGLLASRLLGGGGGLLGGLFGRGAAGGAGGLINATRGAGGAYNITTLGAGGGGALAAASRFAGVGGAVLGGGYALSKLGKEDASGNPTKDQGFMDWLKGTFSWTGIKNTLNVKKNLWDDNTTKRLVPIDGRAGGAGGGSTSGKKSGGGGSAKGSSTANAASVIKAAEQQLGDPYVWGGTGPDGWDCSGLMQWAFGQAGVKLPRTSQEQQRVGKAVATDKVQPGDLLFNGNPAHHVVMAIGGGKIIEAPRTGLNVRIRGFKPGEFTNARRIVGSVGNMGDIASPAGDTTTLNEQQSTVGGNIGGAYGGTSELAALMSALGGGTGGGSMGLAAQATSAASTSDSKTSNVGGKNPPGNPKGNIALGKKMAAQQGWTGNQWKALYNLWMGESGWDEHADNPSSDAYGIPQAMSNIHKETATAAWRNSAEKQIAWGMKYIKGRYGSPAKAWSFWNSKNPHWYDQGAWDLENDATARVHKGEMILPAKQAESVRNAIVNTMTTGSGSSGGGGIVFQSGSIVVQASGSMTPQEAKMTGKMIVDAVTEDKRIKDMQRGY
jgi:cell wall-associated NlpC family hydrolase